MIFLELGLRVRSRFYEVGGEYIYSGQIFSLVKEWLRAGPRIGSSNSIDIFLVLSPFTDPSLPKSSVTLLFKIVIAGTPIYLHYKRILLTPSHCLCIAHKCCPDNLGLAFYRNGWRGFP